MNLLRKRCLDPARDKRASAKFLADILNLEAGPEWGHFVPVRTANGVTLDFDEREDFGRSTLRSWSARRSSTRRWRASGPAAPAITPPRAASVPARSITVMAAAGSTSTTRTVT
jgi:hypothetical protein